MKPHKHAELIKAWADGAEIEQRYQTNDSNNSWSPWHAFDGCWLGDDEWEWEYRIVTKPDYHSFLALISKEHDIWRQYGYIANYSEFSQIVKLTHNGETHELKSAEVLK